ncbi:MAG: FtsX-like permease family protein [Bacteroidetes bacterium]|nr:FtsX-like permease family protein [Bacteroidota bacterium]
MLTNHIKIAFRNLLKNPFFSSLNLLGLAIGLAVSLALALFVKEELSFDRFHKNASNLYRAGLDVTYEGKVEKWVTAPNIAGPAFAAEIAEVDSYCRFLRHSFGQTAFLNVAGQNFAEKDLYWVDSTVFSMFDVPLLKGDPNTALVGLNKVVLSEETAKKMFGQNDPMGKTITLENDRNLVVTGIFEDFPDNSTLDAKAMASFISQDWAAKNLYWSNCSFETYFQLHPKANMDAVERQMNEVLNRQVQENERWFSFWLQPLTEVHLYSQGLSAGYSTRLGDIRQVRWLGWLALSVLLLACFNYVNMTTARSQQRFREVGINKTLGASSGQMVQRFFVETGILVAVSLALGTLLVQVTMPFLEQITGRQMSILGLLQSKWGWAFPAVWAGVTLVAGLYPALFLSSFTPKKLLSPVQVGASSANFFRKTLVISQFTVCVALIIGAIVFQQQLDFISQKKLGFEPDQVVAINTAGAKNGDQIKSFNTEAGNLSSVKKVVRSQSYPGEGTSGYTMSKPGQAEKVVGVSSCWAEPGFEEVLSLKLLAGRTLPPKTKEDTTIQVVMNETGIEFLGYTPEEAIGKSLTSLYQGRATTIVGVVEDFNFESLHSPVTPYVFCNGNDIAWNPFTLIKLQTTDLRSTMSQLEAVFKKHAPNSAFEYTFLDDTLNRMYSSEQQMSRVILLFTILTIFISCLGLFGLAAFTAERRTKEIGVRKVLGATVAGVVGLLAKDFLKPVVMAIVIAAPLAWYAMNTWLQGFAFRVEIQWWHFVLAGLLAIGLAFLTVSFQSVKAALANPVKSLRSE